MRIALTCSGLGSINRGHEVFARGLFDLLSNSLDITLFKGAGEPSPREVVIAHLPRDSALLDEVHVVASPRWYAAAQELERLRIEGETFGYSLIKPLMEGQFDIVHCLEQEVTNVVFDNRHLFRRPPKVVFSNGGAIPRRSLPRCDFVQEHTFHNLRFSDRRKAFMIPHGVDIDRFRPGVPSDFRMRHGIASDAFVVISVGSIGHNHKRMDYVIREVAQLRDAHLIIVGQESREAPEIKALGRDLLGTRVTFATLAHDDLPSAYAAADAFALGSIFETFGLVYIEAMAMGLPVFCTDHANQRAIVQEGVFVNMRRPGALAAALRDVSTERRRQLGERARKIAEEHYDLRRLAKQYCERYSAIAAAPDSLPTFTWRNKVKANLQNAWRAADDLVRGRAE